MNFSQLSQDYIDDYLADAMYSREVEFFQFDFDRKNFEKLIEILPEGQFKDGIKKRLQDTLSQMASVEAIYAALQSQIKDQAAHEAAVERVTTKREIEGAKK